MTASSTDASHMGVNRNHPIQSSNEIINTSTKKLKHLISLSLKNGDTTGAFCIRPIATGFGDTDQTANSKNGDASNNIVLEQEKKKISLANQDSYDIELIGKLRKFGNSSSNSLNYISEDTPPGTDPIKSSRRNHSIIEKSIEREDFRKAADAWLLDTFASIYVINDPVAEPKETGNNQSHQPPIYVSKLVEHERNANYNPLVTSSEDGFNNSCVPPEYRNARTIKIQIYGRRHLEALKFGDKKTQWFSLLNCNIDFDSLVPLYLYEPNRSVQERDIQIESLNFKTMLKLNAIILYFSDGIYTVKDHISDQYILSRGSQDEQDIATENKSDIYASIEPPKSYSTDIIVNDEYTTSSASSSYTSLSGESILTYKNTRTGASSLTTPSFDGLLKLISLESCLEDGLNTIEHVKNSINSRLGEDEKNNKMEIRANYLYTVKKQLDQDKQKLSQIEGYINTTQKAVETLKSKIEVTKRNIRYRQKFADSIVHAEDQMRRLGNESAELESFERRSLNETISQTIKRRSKIAKELRSIFPINSVSIPINNNANGRLHHQNSNKLRFTICGVGFPDMSNEISGTNSRIYPPEVELNTALGYMGQLTNLLSYYLSVPLRYPIFPFGSETFIVDPISELPNSPNTAIASFGNSDRLNNILSLDTDIAQLSGANAFPLYIENQTGFGFGNLFGRTDNTRSHISKIPKATTENVSTITSGNGGFALFEYGIFLLGMNIVQICESIGLSVMENEGTISDLLGNLKMILLVLEGNE